MRQTSLRLGESRQVHYALLFGGQSGKKNAQDGARPETPSSFRSTALMVRPHTVA